MTRTRSDVIVPLAQVHQPCAEGMNAARGLAHLSGTYREVLEIDRALKAIATASAELARVWRDVPADGVHAYPLAHSADEPPDAGYVSGRAEVLAQILRECGHPAFVEADGRLIVTTLDGEVWATGLGGWHFLRLCTVDGESTADPAFRASPAGDYHDQALSAAAEDFYRETIGTVAPMPAADLAPLLVDAVRHYNAEAFARGV